MVEIGIFRIGRTVVDRDEVRKWLDFIGADAFEIPEDGGVSNPALLIALAGKRCYKSFQPGLNPNVSKIRSDYTSYFDNILASGHGSVLEHAVFNFAFENVSRVFTGEMNRHRAGWAISEGSMRFIRYSKDIPYWVPDSINGPDALGSLAKDRLYQALEYSLPAPDISDVAQDANGDARPLTLDEKKHATRMMFDTAFRQQAAAYSVMEAIWAAELAPESKFKGKKEITSMMRRIIGMGVATGGVWSGNARALRHVMTMRCAPAAEEEILHVFSRVAKMMQESEPLLFGDFTVDEVTGCWKPAYVKV